MANEQPEVVESFGQSMRREELRRARAEAAKLEAERRKIELETEELERERGMVFFKRKRFIQAVIAGIVAIPLLWFFIKDVALPLHQIENIQLARENELVRDSLKRVERDLNSEILRLSQERQWLQTERDGLDSAYTRLGDEYQQLSHQYSLSERDRVAFSKRADSLAAVAREARRPVTFTLYEGWNAVPFTGSRPAPVREVFAPIEDVLRIVQSPEGDTYSPVWGVEQFETAIPNTTYQVYVVRDTKITFPK